MIVRESINFVRGKSSKESLGVGRRAEIHRFFDELDIDREDYTIDDNFGIYFKGNLDLDNSQIRELPSGLEVGGNLFLRGSKIEELPPDLKVGEEIYKNF
jgi:hypothetical protein